MRLSILFIFLSSFFMCGAINASAQGYDVLAEIDNNEELTRLVNVCPSELVQDASNDYSAKKDYCSTNHETCLLLCEGGSSSHCLGLARHFQHNDVDRTYTRKLFAKSCQLGIASGCTNMAASLKSYDGLDTAQCYTETFRKTCEAEDAWGCTMYAVSLVYGEGVKKSTKRALKAIQDLEKQCDVDDPFRACTAGGELAEQIRNGDFDED